DFDMPPGGLNIRHEIDFLGQEARLHEFKRGAAAAFVRANGLNRIVYSGGSGARIGIITVGKSYLDVRQALEDIGIDEERANEIGVRLFKVGCPWPLDIEHIRDFARGLEMIVVVEEKRSLIEVQVREDLYGAAMQPVVIGKKDERGHWLFPVKGALDPNDIAIALGERVLKVIGPSEEIAARVGRLKQYQAMLADTKDIGSRTPFFCSGCPHNTSTTVPEGSIAGAGIGCHFMALWMDRDTVGFTQMGGEGAQWIGQAPFSKRDHIFQNLGDGTYNHSGILALRFALAAGVNITYKILYNDAVAMTGGQPHEGGLTADMIARQVHAEGVGRLAVVSDEPDKYDRKTFPPIATFHHRGDLDLVQRELRQVKGVSVLLYDQTCAAEKRRRRKRGSFPDPDRRVIINELVCEGCGDCGVKSNCVSVQPLETEFGRKRRIDQSSCNKDFSCVNGFCPSFVTVHGAKMRKADGVAGEADPLEGVPEPQQFPLDRDGWASIIDGVGGTGVVTVGAILGMAAHLEGKGCGMIDMAGLAQKGGSVFSHVRIAKTPDDIHAIRVSAGKADLILGCDLVVSGARKVLAAVRENHTIFVANTAEVMPGEFARSADYSLPTERLRKAIRQAAGEDKAHFFDATHTASALFGNSLGANMFMLGFACQHGGLPLSIEAVEKAIELNGQAVSMNISAFRWGRRAAHQPQFVRDLVARATGAVHESAAPTIDDVIARRAEFLTAYQNAAYARRYRDRVAAVRAAEAGVAPGSTSLTEAVAKNLFKLMAVKDEYEVARLYTDGSFAKQLAKEFQSFGRLEFHLAPPILGRKGADGMPRKSSFGPWMMKGFGMLAALKGLRGTVFDVFGYSDERRFERTLLAQYEQDIDLILGRLSPGRIQAATALASVPSLIRGYGHVKRANADTASGERARLLERLPETPAAPVLEAAE
ncbi:MAG: indolepyruvate ferredoxin oxidoreductase family protein, partial [Pseudomonadota bacterium]|nr:indolepyruvate ferredoxin oxidoreductase family protein [Pseudomonadota bacterium]